LCQSLKTLAKQLLSSDVSEHAAEAGLTENIVPSISLSTAVEAEVASFVRTGSASF
jgi:hypothetical protein